MQKLIKDGCLVDDYWVLVKEASNTGILNALPGRSLIVPLDFWRLFREELDDFYGEVTIWLNSDQNVHEIAAELENLPLVALNFPVFSDGRSYTNARELRETLGYKGEVRAIGDVLRDQLYYMSRCGFDTFSMRSDQDLDECLTAFNDFHTGYQGGIDQPNPLFRRR
jgi:uncharacterized protein (DUF934 family)